MAKAESHICSTCGTPVDPKTKTRGSFLVELILWCCFVVPGLIYSLWRLTTRFKACKHCGSQVLVPVGTPAGKALLKQYGWVRV